MWTLVYILCPFLSIPASLGMLGRQADDKLYEMGPAIAGIMFLHILAYGGAVTFFFFLHLHR